MSESSPARLPPMDGTLNVLPGFVDFHAKFNPSLPWAKFEASNPSGVEMIDFAEFARATHRVAHALRPGREGRRDGEVIAVLIHCDTILYLALLAGMVRAGLVPFPLSPRNSPEAVYALLQKTSCHKLIVQPSLSGLGTAVQNAMHAQELEFEVIRLPELHHIFPSLHDNPTVEVDAYPRGPSAAPDDVLFIVHSSGSTGHPKPLPQTNRSLLEWGRAPCVYKARERGISWATLALPTFHTMGFNMQLCAPLVSGRFGAVYPPQAPEPPIIPTAQNLISGSRATGCSGMMSVPAFVEVWAQSKEDFEYLAGLDIVCFAGGPLSDVNGDKLIAAGAKLFSVYGGSEFGAPSDCFDCNDSPDVDEAVMKTSTDWAWLQFADWCKPRWIPEGDGTYELQFLTCATHHPVVENLPDIQGYATSDLFMPHPKKKGLWKIVGRTDDVIVLGTGEKIVPLAQEGFIGALPFVKGVVMFGRARAQAGVLIELHPNAVIDPNDEKALADFRNTIWPHVEEANKLAPSFARIFKEMVLVTDSLKPMPRAGKGTVQRKMVVSIYEKEIERLFETIEASMALDEVDVPSLWTAVAVEEWLVKHATIINNGRTPSAAADIFEQDFDSLSATFLRNRVIGALKRSSQPAARAAASEVPQDLIFRYPVLQHLASAIVDLVEGGEATYNTMSHAEQIQELFEKYSKDLPDFSSKIPPNLAQGRVVLITGATGNLGSHILAALVQSPTVKRVYTVDRGPQPADRLRSSFQDRSLPVRLLESEKLVICIGDLSKPDLGLSEKVLKEVHDSVTHVLHNAWKLDFNLSVTSFESHIAGARNVIDFCARCDVRVKLIFSSTIGAMQGWDPAKGPVPEEVFPDPSVAVGNGYGESKYVVERVRFPALLAFQLSDNLFQLLVDVRAKDADTLCVRIGQLCGSTTAGTWNPTDWVPIIVKSSISLGYLPDLAGTVDWVPVDVAAGTFLDAVESATKLPDAINLVHPMPTPWTVIFSAGNSVSGRNLKLITFDDWLTKVEAKSAAATEHDFDSIPAIKLIRFLRHFGSGIDPGRTKDSTLPAGRLLVYSNARAQSMSPALRSALPIDASSVALWFKYWGRKSAGFV
ncbi:putative NRPS-like protein biosynthetic cluster [Steccherinum ochraceum]|uniref:Putative NRPS-like protein biosynthetic cluster n=1 Tax=Steccherinum ochraceum TaxID=92696 RepID=A0A4R0RL02_9APHY|nr:putative NRPS-like protein biosynthetic cluster [Steccherinum ochraceum]